MKKGLSSNLVKLIAIVLVIIDHVGLYMYKDFSDDIYFLLRSIGRMAMPIFTYFIVQGFFYTKNLKKYVLRFFVLAVVTQIILFVLGYINQVYYSDYWIGVNNYLGILFSYTFSLILLAVFDKKIWIEKLDENKNWIVRIIAFILVAWAYIRLNIEFDMRIPFMVLAIFAVEKFFMRDDRLIYRQVDCKMWTRLVYLALILIIFAISLAFVTYSPGNKFAMLGAIVPIALYNGRKGKDNRWVQYLFYAVFPLQHLVLYLVAMVG